MHIVKILKSANKILSRLQISNDVIDETRELNNPIVYGWNPQPLT